MLKTTCPPTCPLVQVLFHFVGPTCDALRIVDMSLTGFFFNCISRDSKIMYWTCEIESMDLLKKLCKALAFISKMSNIQEGWKP